MVSGNGNNHSAIGQFWLVTIITVVVLVVICVWGRNSLGYTRDIFWGGSQRNGLWYFFTAFIPITIVMGLIEGFLLQARIVATEVRVTENGVTGKSVSEKFPTAFIYYFSIRALELSDFKLDFDQISSVDVLNGKCLIIHATSAQHKIYVMNALEIRDEIQGRLKR